MVMHYESKHLQIAAIMVGDGDTGLLSGDLCNAIDKISEYVVRAGGELKSRQVIALIIQQWAKDHPGEKLYHYGG